MSEIIDGIYLNAYLTESQISLGGPTPNLSGVNKDREIVYITDWETNGQLGVDSRPGDFAPAFEIEFEGTVYRRNIVTWESLISVGGPGLKYAEDGDTVGVVRSRDIDSDRGAQTGYTEGEFSYILGDNTRAEGAFGNTVSGYNTHIKHVGSNMSVAISNYGVIDQRNQSVLLGGTNNAMTKIDVKYVVRAISNDPAADGYTLTESDYFCTTSGTILGIDFNPVQSISEGQSVYSIAEQDYYILSAGFMVLNSQSDADNIDHSSATTIIGGLQNKIYGINTQGASILGGMLNKIGPGSIHSIILGGYDNQLSLNLTTVPSPLLAYNGIIASQQTRLTDIGLSFVASSYRATITKTEEGQANTNYNTVISSFDVEITGKPNSMTVIGSNFVRIDNNTNEEPYTDNVFNSHMVLNSDGSTINGRGENQLIMNSHWGRIDSVKNIGNIDRNSVVLSQNGRITDANYSMLHNTEHCYIANDAVNTGNVSPVTHSSITNSIGSAIRGWTSHGTIISSHQVSIVAGDALDTYSGTLYANIQTSTQSGIVGYADNSYMIGHIGTNIYGTKTDGINSFGRAVHGGAAGTEINGAFAGILASSYVHILHGSRYSNVHHSYRATIKDYSMRSNILTSHTADIHNMSIGSGLYNVNFSSISGSTNSIIMASEFSSIKQTNFKYTVLSRLDIRPTQSELDDLGGEVLFAINSNWDISTSGKQIAKYIRWSNGGYITEEWEYYTVSTGEYIRVLDELPLNNGIENTQGLGRSYELTASNPNTWTDTELSYNSYNGIYHSVQSTITDSAGSIILSGGWNSINGDNSGGFNAIIAGEYNTIDSSGKYQLIGGGLENTITSADAAILHGHNNQILVNVTNTQSASFATISGGIQNVIIGSPTSLIGGGRSNTITSEDNTGTNSSASSISGGIGNIIENAGYPAFIGAGQNNGIAVEPLARNVQPDIVLNKFEIANRYAWPFDRDPVLNDKVRFTQNGQQSAPYGGIDYGVYIDGEPATADKIYYIVTIATNDVNDTFDASAANPITEEIFPGDIGNFAEGDKVFISGSTLPNFTPAYTTGFYTVDVISGSGMTLIDSDGVSRVRFTTPGTDVSAVINNVESQSIQLSTTPSGPVGVLTTPNGFFEINMAYVESSGIYTDTGLGSVIVGGSDNYTNGIYSTIVGGSDNAMQFISYGLIVGGRENKINFGESAAHSTIITGYGNAITSAPHSIIISGRDNLITGAGSLIEQPSFSALIIGGIDNRIGSAVYSHIGMGQNCAIGFTDLSDDILDYIGSYGGSYIPASSAYSNIISGQFNRIFSCNYGFIGAGVNNNIWGVQSTDSFIGTGQNHRIVSAFSGFIGTGDDNRIGGNRVELSDCNLVPSGGPSYNIQIPIGGISNNPEAIISVGDYVLLNLQSGTASPDFISNASMYYYVDSVTDNVTNTDITIALHGPESTIIPVDILDPGTDAIYTIVMSNSNSYAVIVNGKSNRAYSSSAFIGNGYDNKIGVLSSYAVIDSGQENTIQRAPEAFIGNGYRNTIVNTGVATILSGENNFIGNSENDGDREGGHSTILNGDYNSILGVGRYQLIGGGIRNTVSGHVAMSLNSRFSTITQDSGPVPINTYNSIMSSENSHIGIGGGEALYNSVMGSNNSGFVSTAKFQYIYASTISSSFGSWISNSVSGSASGASQYIKIDNSSNVASIATGNKTNRNLIEFSRDSVIGATSITLTDTTIFSDSSGTLAITFTSTPVSIAGGIIFMPPLTDNPLSNDIGGIDYGVTYGLTLVSGTTYTVDTITFADYSVTGTPQIQYIMEASPAYDSKISHSYDSFIYANSNEVHIMNSNTISAVQTQNANITGSSRVSIGGSASNINLINAHDLAVPSSNDIFGANVIGIDPSGDFAASTFVSAMNSNGSQVFQSSAISLLNSLTDKVINNTLNSMILNGSGNLMDDANTASIINGMGNIIQDTVNGNGQPLSSILNSLGSEIDVQGVAGTGYRIFNISYDNPVTIVGSGPIPDTDNRWSLVLLNSDITAAGGLVATDTITLAGIDSVWPSIDFLNDYPLLNGTHTITYVEAGSDRTTIWFEQAPYPAAYVTVATAGTLGQWLKGGSAPTAATYAYGNTIIGSTAAKISGVGTYNSIIGSSSGITIAALNNVVVLGNPSQGISNSNYVYAETFDAGDAIVAARSWIIDLQASGGGVVGNWGVGGTLTVDALDLGATTDGSSIPTSNGVGDTTGLLYVAGSTHPTQTEHAVYRAP